MSVSTWLFFLAAAAIGAVARYTLDVFVQDRVRSDLPWGTGVVNLSGSFVLGLLTGLALYHAFPEDARVVLGTGFCGAYTTFSTFTFETLRLAEGGRMKLAARNVMINTGGGLLFAAAGLALAAL